MKVPWLSMNFRWINALLWGNSVALAWMWGLGLFFSVQMTFMFGLQGLLLFAIPNAFGLMMFGLLTQIVARRHAGGQESLALFFDKFAKPFRLIFYLYQVLALTLTVFALTKYLFRPLELVSGPLTGLYLCMVVFVVLAAGCLFGEEFGIQRIKFGHGLLGGLLVACVAVVLSSLHPLVPDQFQWGAAGMVRGLAWAGSFRLCDSVAGGPAGRPVAGSPALAAGDPDPPGKHLDPDQLFFRRGDLFPAAAVSWLSGGLGDGQGRRAILRARRARRLPLRARTDRAIHQPPGRGFQGPAARRVFFVSGDLRADHPGQRLYRPEMVSRQHAGQEPEHVDRDDAQAPARLADPEFPASDGGHAGRVVGALGTGVFHGVLRLVFRRLRVAGDRPLLCAQLAATAAADPDVFAGEHLAGDLRLRLLHRCQRAADSRVAAAAGVCDLAGLQYRPAARGHREGRGGHRGRGGNPGHPGASREPPPR